MHAHVHACTYMYMYMCVWLIARVLIHMSRFYLLVFCVSVVCVWHVQLLRNFKCTKCECVFADYLISGVEDSPMMTWGTVDGTPLRIEGGMTPLHTSGPSFKMPKAPKREQIGVKLAVKASKAYTERKKKALETATSSLLKSRYVRMCVHTYVCIYVHMYICMYVCMYICMYVCTVCMYVCMSVSVYTYLNSCVGFWCSQVHCTQYVRRLNVNQVRIILCIIPTWANCTCIYVCTYLFVHLYMCIHVCVII